MAKNKIAVLLLCLVLVLLHTVAAGCSPGEEVSQSENDTNTTAENGERDDNDEPSRECPFPPGLVLPQVSILGKLNYAQADLDALQTNVIEPLVAYFESQGQTVVSIAISGDNPGGSVKNSFGVDVIISRNEGSHDGSQLSFLHEKVDGNIPVWEMETIE